ncbi:MAG: primosomal protein N' [Magnetococcales bacterium]|nr:primosomal protein N' [Magnetococcales bacterium]
MSSAAPLAAPPAPRFAQVALPLPLRTLFSYHIPDELLGLCRPGGLVLVPFGKGTRQGIVWELSDEAAWSGGEIKPLADLLGEEPVLDEAQRHLVDWMARYYLHPIGLTAWTALPPWVEGERKLRAVWLGSARPAEKSQALERIPANLRELAAAVAQRSHGLLDSTLAGKFGRPGLERRLRQLAAGGWLALEEQWSVPEGGRRRERPLVEELPLTPPPRLNDEQQICVETIRHALERRRFAPFLLHGVTGSGKTEVYFQAVETCLAQGRQALLLLPEIALTPQLAGRFRARFREGLALFHSGQSESRRREEWLRVKRGEAPVVAGARSALFAPLERLGLVVVDEEHESSYKQEEGLPYHGRDMALVRARRAGAVVVLSSATPSLESLANAASGKYALLRLTRRATGAPMPRVELSDLTQATREKRLIPGHLLGPDLTSAMEETLAAGRQVLLFLNRRGYAPALLCPRCGFSFQCPHCSVALTYHATPHPSLRCHYCDFRQPARDVCPRCGQQSLSRFGPGDQRLEKEVRERFPEARCARLDRDSVASGGAGAMEDILEQFAEGTFEILLGTQMVAKGHHFPGVALVGVVLADLGLNQPDFRAAERTFQLTAQVAGRAGREDVSPGRVVVQCHDPSHYALRAALSQDVERFRQLEEPLRREAGFPPFGRLALIRFSCEDRAAGELFKSRTRGWMPQVPGVTWLGPVESPLFKLRNWFRWQILVKEAAGGRRLHGALEGFLALATAESGPVRLEINVDPQSFQ